MDFLSALIRIVVIDLVLSGDNAVVIGMAAHRLKPSERKTAILVGGGAAIALRIALTAIAALLLRLSGLRLMGGVLLVWIGFKLLREDTGHEGIKEAGSLRDAITTILVADFIMSTDNVLGVAAASNGNISLLIFGLMFSMAILMFMGSLVANLVNKFWWLSYAGSAVIAWTGAAMMFEDPLTHDRLAVYGSVVEYAAKILVTVGTLAFAHWFHRSSQERE